LPLSFRAQVAGNNFISDAYTPVSWPTNAATHKACVADPSGRTFLFSLVNAHGRAVKLRLKDGQHNNAIKLNGATWGPGFGGGADKRLMRYRAANENDGCLAAPASFELDQESERAAGLPPIPFVYDNTLLAGDRGGFMFGGCFAAAEIEVYQL
jgi:hypothetical protein